jgi:hypothetical protein
MTRRWIMSKNIILVLMYHRHKLLDFKSLRLSAVQCGLAKSTAHVVTKLLKLWPHKTTAVYRGLPPDYETRIRFYRLFQESVFIELLDPGLTFYSDEVWFALIVRYTARMTLEHRKPSCCSWKATVWFTGWGLVCNSCAENKWAFLFKETNSERYVRLTVTLLQSSDEEKRNAKTHTGNTSTDALHEIFGRTSQTSRTAASAITKYKSLWLLFVGPAERKCIHKQYALCGKTSRNIRRESCGILVQQLRRMFIKIF